MYSIWGTDEKRRKELFGEQLKVAEEELNKFKQEENFILELMNSYKNLE